MYAPKLRRASAQDLEVLLNSNDEEFVNGAYKTLLNRSPDAAGAASYLAVLRAGTSKIAILRELSNSEECQRNGVEIPALAKILAMEVSMHAPSETSPSETGIASLDLLLTINDDATFISSASDILLTQNSSPELRKKYQDMLSAGIPRVQILYQMARSPDASNHCSELSGLIEGFAREGLPVAPLLIRSYSHMPKPAGSFIELLSHDGTSFVACAYLSLLGREPDDQGLRDRLTQLLDGCTKPEILLEMMQSEESATAVVIPKWRKSAFLWCKLARVSLIGRMVNAYLEFRATTSCGRRRRALEQRVGALEVLVARQYDPMHNAQPTKPAPKPKE